MLSKAILGNPAVCLGMTLAFCWLQTIISLVVIAYDLFWNNAEKRTSIIGFDWGIILIPVLLLIGIPILRSILCRLSYVPEDDHERRAFIQRQIPLLKFVTSEDFAEIALTFFLLFSAVFVSRHDQFDYQVLGIFLHGYTIRNAHLLYNRYRFIRSSPNEGTSVSSNANTQPRPHNDSTDEDEN